MKFPDKNEQKRFLKYFIIGCINTGVDFVAFTVISFLFPDKSVMLAQSIGHCTGTICSYTLNRKFTFRSGERYLSSTLLKFLCNSIMMLLLSNGIIAYLTNTLLINRYISKVFTTIVIFGFGYINNKLWVFKQ